MVPTYTEAVALWKTYQLPEIKQQHSLLVAKLALYFASKLTEKKPVTIQTDVLFAAALLHDIDKNIPHREGERHPDTGVRILTDSGMPEVARMVKTHPLHAILDPAIAPATWEEKLLFLSDKMTKHETISVEERFALWRAEPLPKEEVNMLEKSYPKVKQLEQEILTGIGLTSQEVIKASKNSILTKEGVFI
jgi:putative nucleotidyltransferase with HDIG domain